MSPETSPDARGAAPTGSHIRVVVAYLGASGPFVLALEVAVGTPLGAALAQSGVLEQCPEIDLTRYRVGVYGQLMDLNQTLEDGDRAEVYPPLIADPRAARKRRAQAIDRQ